ncbi:histone-fold protein [Rutstroemia sp. NJR-2017a WRK4]|nr:histone-fold protein [Rutstroemia sp. NJR-2017a WRK4]
MAWRHNPNPAISHVGGPASQWNCQSSKVQFNVAAKNGSWNAFQLVAKDTGHVSAWFVCHSDVDPEIETDKILRVSGSPYKPDSGSQFNNEKTAAEAVYAINRYDWGWYDKRGKEELGINDEVNIENLNTRVFGEGVGLVDFGVAKTEVLRWQKKERHEIDTRPGGIWMFIPCGECMFGRFGFDEGRVAARSFIIFTTYTNFTNTTFVGLDKTLRIFETDEERFQRRLREGYDFEGLDTLDQMRNMFEDWNSMSLPAESEYLGPYDSHEYLVQTIEFEAIPDGIELLPQSSRRYSEFAKKRLNRFTDPWKEKCHVCLNEVLLSYLEHFIVPVSSHDTVAAAAVSLFPRRNQDGRVDSKHMYSYMMEPHLNPVPAFDDEGLEGRIKNFLAPRCKDDSLVKNDEFVAGIRSCITYLLSQVLEQVAEGVRLSLRNTNCRIP